MEKRGRQNLSLFYLFIFNFNKSKVEADSLFLELICLWCFSLTNRPDDKYLVNFGLLV